MKKLFGGTTRAALIHAATQYDIKQSANPRRQQSPYALSHYFARIEDIEADIAAGANVRAAITAAFTGSLLSAMLRAVGEAKPTTDELRGTGRMVYRPASQS